MRMMYSTVQQQRGVQDNVRGALDALLRDEIAWEMFYFKNAFSNHHVLIAAVGGDVMENIAFCFTPYHATSSRR